MITEAQYNRICWHSRRGMLELDLLLGPFVRDHFKQQSERDQQRYVRLLKEEDQDLFRWLLSADKPEDPELAATILLILKLHHDV